MEIFVALIWIILGIIGVLWGADRFTDGAASVARRFHVSQLVIGLTIVAFGTSAPELFVSFVSAWQGAPGMAVGNVIGSNIFNILLIVGVSAAIYPISIQRNTVKYDLPIMIASSILMVLLCGLDHNISSWDAVMLLICFVAYMVYTFYLTRNDKVQMELEDNSSTASTGFMSLSKSIGCVLLGLICLMVCSSVFVRGASQIASFLGVSDVVIGLTVVACGTSLPELATSVIAARKGQSDLAIGNVVGSCIFNILLILGVTGIICPIRTEDVSLVDYSLFLGCTFILSCFSYTKYKIERWEGIILCLVFLSYMIWIVLQA